MEITFENWKLREIVQSLHRTRESHKPEEVKRWEAVCAVGLLDILHAFSYGNSKPTLEARITLCHQK